MAVKPVSASPEVSEGEFEMKAMGMIEDYLNIRDIEEVIMCLNELKSPSLMHVVIRAAVNCTLEKNPQARYSVGMLFHKLLKAGHLTKAKFVDGFKEVLMYADDMVLEIPRIWRYLGEMIGATFRDNSLSLKLLADMMEPVRAVDKAGDLMAEILRTAVKLNGADVVGEMWQSSGFTWDMFLPIGVDVKEFVNRKKLDFTLSVSASPELSGHHSSKEPKKVIQPVLQTIKLSTACENALMPDEDMPSVLNTDQWSPMNPQVRKQYSRDFLLQFRQYCIDKPEGLPHIPDIVLDKADIRPPSFDPPDYSRGGADCIPAYLKAPRGDLDLFKKFKSLLDKLTPYNFQELKAKAMDYPIDTEKRLKRVIDLIYDKAINESSFSRTYAELCRDLSQLKVPAASGTGMVQLRTLLINRCQKEFEKIDWDGEMEKREREAIAKLPVDQRTSALEDLELILINNKQRMLGNIRFIGELFKLQMLIEQTMHDCIFKLLCSKDNESLECVSHLMSTIGKILDHQKAKNCMDQYFHQIRNLISNEKTSARVRFMLQDLTDLRARNWVPRQANNNNPNTIKQIRQDFKREEEQ